MIAFITGQVRFNTNLAVPAREFALYREQLIAVNLVRVRVLHRRGRI